MQENILVTGAGGFVGSHLVAYLLEIASERFTLHGNATTTDLLLQAGVTNHPNLHLHNLNLEDAARLNQLVAALKPRYIFHLAAQSFVNPSFANPGATLTNNINSTLNLFEAVRQAGLAAHTRLLNVGSSDQYGYLLPEDMPVQETAPFRPGNPYAVSKIAQEYLGYQYFRSYGLQIINTRAFNHLGARQNPQLAISAFAQQVAQAEAGMIEPMVKVGNLQASRDFTDVLDIVKGYWLALQTDLPDYPGCQPGEAYNLCSGRDYTIQSLLDRLLGLATIPLKVVPDQNRMRPSDMPFIRGDYSKFQQATGWQPQIDIQNSLQNLLNYWRNTL